jgi:hypothetical protein
MNDDSPFAALGILYEVPVEEPLTLAQWLRDGKPGSKFVYATRHALDSETPADVLKDARLARESYALGIVELVQQRNERGGPFNYVAIKKREKRVPLVNGLPWQATVSSPTCGYRSAIWKKG